MARNSGGGFGTWFYGFLVGGVIGVGCCAAAALYITKAPIPFVNKVNQASEKINPIAGGTIPDPNKPLSASGGAPVNAPKSRVVTVEPPTSEQAAEETKLQMNRVRALSCRPVPSALRSTLKPEEPSSDS